MVKIYFKVIKEKVSDFMDQKIFLKTINTKLVKKRMSAFI